MKKIFIVFLAIFFIASSCTNREALTGDHSAIVKLLQQERKAHFERNVDLFISEFADSMISVNKGEVKVPERNAQREKVGNYFSTMNFIKWEDLADPIIRFDNDGNLAYAVIQKRVVVSYHDSTGITKIDSTDYAWVSIYRKTGKEWKVECNISTNK